MTDGPMGFQVAPITEDDMSRVTDILKRAADAIVGMSQLKADVDMLQATVKGLQADTERLRTQNANLDEALAHVRQERDVAHREAADWQAKANEAEASRDSFRNQVNDLSFAKLNLETELAQAKTERDDHGFRALDLEDQLNAAKAKLAKLQDSFSAVFGKASWDEVQPAVQAVEPLAPGVVETSIEPITKSLEVDFSKPYHYDDNLHRYVNDPESIEPDGKAIPF